MARGKTQLTIQRKSNNIYREFKEIKGDGFENDDHILPKNQQVYLLIRNNPNKKYIIVLTRHVMFAWNNCIFEYSRYAGGGVISKLDNYWFFKHINDNRRDIKIFRLPSKWDRFVY